MKIFEQDAKFTARKIAMRYLRRYLQEHQELENDFEALNAIYNRAFLPKAQVNLCKKLHARGHEIIPGIGPLRTSVIRFRERFIQGLTRTIKESSDRLDRARLQ